MGFDLNATSLIRILVYTWCVCASAYACMRARDIAIFQREREQMHFILNYDLQSFFLNFIYFFLLKAFKTKHYCSILFKFVSFVLCLIENNLNNRNINTFILIYFNGVSFFLKLFHALVS